MIKIQGMLLIIVLLCLSGVYLHAAKPDSLDLKAGESLYLKAKKALKSGDIKTYQQLKPLLINYPLYPYLWYEDLSYRLNIKSAKEVKQFLNLYSDSPLSDQLIYRWLAFLGKNKHWKDYLNFYQQTATNKKIHGNVLIQCYRLQSQMALNNHFPSTKQLKKLWLVGKSQPEACNPLFENWKKQGDLTEQLILSRIWLAFDENQIRLVNHLQAMMPLSKQTWITLAKKIYQTPTHAISLVKQKTDFWKSPYANHIIVMLVKRLSLLDYPGKAVTLLEKANQHLQFSHDQQQRMYLSIGLGFAKNTKPITQQWLSKVESAYANHAVSVWQLRLFLLKQDWQSVLNTIERIPNASQQTPLWLYWKARALHQLGEKSKATQIWRKIIDNPGYHGLLARNALGLPALSLTQRYITEDDLKRIATKPNFVRAKLLWKNQLLYAAKAEWYKGIDRLKKEDKYVAAHLAYQMGWYWTAIKTVILAKQPGDAIIRFPIRYANFIREQAKQYQLPEAWILGIIRQESAYEVKVTSVKGARGLMQLMPATARMLAKEKKIALKDGSVLWDPKVNITLGTAYLRALLTTFEDWILASIAYNAGPTRFKTWLNSVNPSNQLPIDILIENLPWYETRNYIKNVIYFTTMYQQRLGMQSPLLALPSIIHDEGKTDDKSTAQNHLSPRLSTSPL